MPAYDRHPNDRELMLRLIEVRSSLADLIYRSGRKTEGIQIDIDLLPVAHRLSLISLCPLECRSQEPAIENAITYDLRSTDPNGALTHANRGIAIYRDLIAQNPNVGTLKQELGSLMAGAATVYKDLGELERSAEYYRQSIAAREALLIDTPNDGVLRRDLVVAYGNYASVLGVEWSPNLNRPAEARVYGSKGVALARGLVSADPDNVTARHDLGMVLGRVGMIEPSPSEIDKLLQALDEARSLMEPIAHANAKSAEIAAQLAMILEYQGYRQEALGKHSGAMASCKGLCSSSCQSTT
jgi:tetratricopeptide (TPR) repeat protein